MCIGTCNDPFVTYLKEFGYNTIRLPRTNVKPLQLLAKTGEDLDWIGDLTDVFVAVRGAEIPPIENNVRATNISGQRTGKLNIGIGLSLLGTILGSMGGTKIGLEVSYKEAKHISFEFPDVFLDQIAIAKLDRFLGQSDINPSSVYVGKLLEADDVYVTTSTLKANRIMVEATKSDESSLAVDIPVVQEMVGASVKVSSSGDKSSKQSYEGTVPLVFGFQAVRLFYENGAYTAMEPLESGSRSAKAAKSKQDDARLLVLPRPFTRLKF